VPTVWFVDMNILCDLVEVPGKCDRLPSTRAEYAERHLAADYFVLPVTTIIETGNHICNAKHPAEHKRRSAEKFSQLLLDAAAGLRRWSILGAEWNEQMVAQIVEGSITGMRFVDLAAHGLLGAGDIAILIERQMFLDRSSFRDVRIWTVENTLQAYS
jgi:hypothetical protein